MMLKLIDSICYLSSQDLKWFRTYLYIHDVYRYVFMRLDLLGTSNFYIVQTLKF